MSLKDHLQDTGVRGSDHQGSHTQTHILKPEAHDENAGQPMPESGFENHAHAGDTGMGNGQISPQTQGQPSTGSADIPTDRPHQSVEDKK